MACVPSQTWVWLSVTMQSQTPLTLPLTRGWELNGRKAQGLFPCPTLVLSSPCVPLSMCAGEGVWSQTAGGCTELLPQHWKATLVAWSRSKCQQHTSIDPYAHRHWRIGQVRQQRKRAWSKVWKGNGRQAWLAGRESAV